MYTKMASNLRLYYMLLLILSLILSLKSQSTILLNKCACDLHGNACDINCCCDEDCDKNDKLTFVCSPNSYWNTTDNRRCVQQSLMFDTHNALYISNTTIDGLFCIYIDNAEERNHYHTPDALNSTADFNEYLGQYSDSSFQPISLAPPNDTSPISLATLNFTSHYKAGDPVFVVDHNNIVGYLRLPKAINSRFCSRLEVIKFLESSTSNCAEASVSLDDLCDSGVLSSQTYYKNLQIIKMPGSIEKIKVGIHNPSEVIDIELGSTHYCCNKIICSACDPVTNSSLSGNLCENAVIKVEYTFQHSTDSGMMKAVVSFTFTSISKDDLPVSQSFATKFGKDIAKVSYRSGNPGYIDGLPIIAASLKGQSLELKVLEASNRLLLLRPSSDGSCDTTKMNSAPILFGENIRTGCFVELTKADIDNKCKSLAFQVKAVLQFSRPLDDITYVAMYGNSAPENRAEWIQLLKNGKVTSTNCDSMVLSVHYQFLYAKTGSVSNAQKKIIGAAAIYGQPQAVRSQCLGVNCGSFNQSLEVIQSVSFIDVSKPALDVVGEPPIFLAKLPNDFFYPFITP